MILEKLIMKYLFMDCEDSPKVFVECFDGGMWRMAYMPIEHAFIAQLMLGDKFRYLVANID